MNQSTLNKLNQMHLWGMEATLKGIMGNIQNDSLTADELVDLLVQAEWEYRENQRIERCLNNAAFRYQAFIAGKKTGQEPHHAPCRLLLH